MYMYFFQHLHMASTYEELCPAVGELIPSDFDLLYDIDLIAVCSVSENKMS